MSGEALAAARGNNATAWTEYSKSMDASMKEKFEQITSRLPDDFFERGHEQIIIDFGTGTGKLAWELAYYCNIVKQYSHGVYVIGTDYFQNYVDHSLSMGERTVSGLAKYNDEEKLKYAKVESKVHFHQLAATDAKWIFKKENASKVIPDVIIFSSVVHEIYSYADLGKTTSPMTKEFMRKKNVLQSLTKAYNVLNVRGRVIIRDFCGPTNNNRVILKQLTVQNDPYTFEKFAETFGQNVDGNNIPLGGHKFDCAPILCHKLDKCGTPTYITDMRSAYEYIFHKDFKSNWSNELQERYGFWTESESVAIMKSAGFDQVFHDIMSGAWIKANRFYKQIKLKILSNEEVPWEGDIIESIKCDSITQEHFPQYQIIIYGDKLEATHGVKKPKSVYTVVTTQGKRTVYEKNGKHYIVTYVKDAKTNKKVKKYKLVKVK